MLTVGGGISSIDGVSGVSGWGGGRGSGWGVGMREREKDAADDEWLGSYMIIFSAEPLVV